MPPIECTGELMGMRRVSRNDGGITETRDLAGRTRLLRSAMVSRSFTYSECGIQNWGLLLGWDTQAKCVVEGMESKKDIEGVILMGQRK
jgi:hypothetical protein